MAGTEVDGASAVSTATGGANVAIYWAVAVLVVTGASEDKERCGSVVGSDDGWELEVSLADGSGVGGTREGPSGLGGRALIASVEAEGSIVDDIGADVVIG